MNKQIFIIVLCLLAGAWLWGQVNISAGNTYTQDFNGIGTNAAATLPTGWKADNDQGVRTVGSYEDAGVKTERSAGNSMTTNASNGIYNFGAGVADTAADRAIGGISSGSASKSVNMYLQLENNGTTPITSLSISYNVEKYRNGTNSAGFSIQMYYSYDGENWTSAGNDFLTSFTNYGNNDDDNNNNNNNNGFTSAPGATVSVTSKNLAQPIIVGGNLYLAWNYSVTSGSTTSNAQALGIDDVSITANAGTDATLITCTNQISGFICEQGKGPSESAQFNLCGVNLQEGIVLNGLTNYEMATDVQGPYSTTLNFSKDANNIVQSSVYVRLKAGLSVGNYNNEEITISSTGATTIKVKLSGSVSVSSPEQPVNGWISAESFTASWEPVSGADGYYIDVYQKVNVETNDLIISEYVEGSSYNKYLEIYNGTNSEIDLTGYELALYSNGATTPNPVNQLNGTLASKAVMVYKHSKAALKLPTGVTATELSSVNYNGNDAIAIRKSTSSDFVDIFGVIGGTAKVWEAGGGYSTKDKTLVRLPSVTAGITTSPTGNDTSSFTTLNTEWELFDINHVSNLGVHGHCYSTAYKNYDVGNVQSYRIEGLKSETDYYYVVRAYHTGTGTHSGNSLEQTLRTGIYDYINTIKTKATEAEDVYITLSGGNGSILTDFTPSNVPNSAFTPRFEQAIELFGSGIDGIWELKIEVDNGDTWAACYHNGAWEALEITANRDNPGTVSFQISTETASRIIQIKTGTGENPTLPVELSAFHISLNSKYQAVLTWVTQTETGVNGFYLYRHDAEDLANACLISPLIPATNTSQQQIYVFTDTELYESGTYYYWLEVVNMDGSEEFYGPLPLHYGGISEGEMQVPLITGIKGLYPNPFNPETALQYSLSQALEVEICIYNNRGQLVRSYAPGTQEKGNHQIIWDGKDQRGTGVSSGVYYFRLQAGKDSYHRKAVLLK